MLELVHEYRGAVTAGGGTYVARVHGMLQPDGRWAGWLTFFPMDGGRVLATDRETVQRSLPDLEYWAAGLSAVYLEGALRRALRLQPEAELARHLAELERIEARARIRAAELEAAAAAARREAEIAESSRERTAEEVLEHVAEGAEAEAVSHEEAARILRGTAETATRARKPRLGRGKGRRQTAGKRDRKPGRRT